MIDDLITMKNALAITPDCPPITNASWNLLSLMQPIHNMCLQALDKLQTDNNGFLSTVLPIIDILVIALVKANGCNHNRPIKSFLESLIFQLRKRFTFGDDINRIYQFAIFFDPRYKNKDLKYFNYNSNIRSELIDLLIRDNQPINSDQSISSNVQPTNQNAIDTFDSIFSETYDAEQNNIQTIQNEIDRYLQAPQVSLTSDICDWWNTNKKYYKQLSNIAKKYLCITPSSASVERLFSQARMMTPYQRSKLSPETIQKCLVVRDNVK